MAIQDSWHIRSRARQCAATETPFEEGDTIVTALFPDPESSGYLRQDFAVAAWESRTDADEPAFSFWRSIYEPPAPTEEAKPLEKDDPESLLRRLVDEDEEHTENARYILAVMLERKKILRETDTQAIPSGVLRVYEHRKTGDAFLVRDPNIPLEQVERVQEEVILLLENGGRRPQPETTEPASTDRETPGTPEPEESARKDPSSTAPDSSGIDPTEDA